MAKWTIYHNPQCSKSREALAMLQAKGIAPEVIEYLKQPPTEKELSSIIQKLKVPAASLVRTKEEIFQALNFNLGSTEAIIQNLAKHPKLLERPIVIKDNVAIIARPTELLKEIL
ncbi:arsenate reductase (glutaredoxin) [Bdellovibrio sp. HCB2-146]|uniref:arsenate reductase (glutaredoxin) n=1 Tax=Bdellovibrio sp. HCB2-146 TaxID=3394362 RepID=UPI0039BC35C7